MLFWMCLLTRGATVVSGSAGENSVIVPECNNQEGFPISLVEGAPARSYSRLMIACLGKT